MRSAKCIRTSQTGKSMPGGQSASYACAESISSLRSSALDFGDPAESLTRASGAIVWRGGLGDHADSSPWRMTGPGRLPAPTTGGFLTVQYRSPGNRDCTTGKLRAMRRQIRPEVVDGAPHLDCRDALRIGMRCAVRWRSGLCSNLRPRHVTGRYPRSQRTGTNNKCPKKINHLPKLLVRRRSLEYAANQAAVDPSGLIKAMSCHVATGRASRPSAS